MSGIPLQSGIIYGPVFSRRLGRSLGINLLPTTHKLCSFDCIYCQYGPGQGTTFFPDREELPSVDQVLTAVERALKKPRTIDYLTFSGNGEPTIHPDFSHIVHSVIKIRDRLRPDVKLALLSNSSRVRDPEVISTVNLLDAPFMKLDAGDEETFTAINHPEPSICLEDIVEALQTIPNLVIQSLLLNGEISNICGDAYRSWVDTICSIKPKMVHVYSMERPNAVKGIVCVSPYRLKEIANEITHQYGLTVKPFWS